MARTYDLGGGYVGTVIRKAKNPAFDPTAEWVVEGPGGRRSGTAEFGINGDPETIMSAMHQAKASMEPVEEKPAEPEEAAEEPEEEGPKRKQGKIPVEFPHQALLEAGDVRTYAQLRKRIEAGTLTEIEGIGDHRATEIVEAYNDDTV